DSGGLNAAAGFEVSISAHNVDWDDPSGDLPIKPVDYLIDLEPYFSGRHAQSSDKSSSDQSSSDQSAGTSQSTTPQGQDSGQTTSRTSCNDPESDQSHCRSK
ncbi:MAG TPA: hypothetical protein VMB81_31565, partial [Candidatus Sulfotelmatobacter sp.]|nr:hypothetical protein [Candidatus Sulfotelmatobacter sp.]